MKYLLLIIAHFLGDFIFQSSTMAYKKRTNFKYMALHCIIYSSFMLLPLILFGPFGNVTIAFLIIVISHVMIDYGRNMILDKLSRSSKDVKTLDFMIFIIDQILHILIIICAIHLLKGTNGLGKMVLNELLIYVSWDQLNNGIILAFLYILCLSPAAVFIKKVFVLFSMQDDNEIKTKDDLVKSGYLIGVLERIIILTLGISGQLAAIGFVFAAKSLARFNQLNDKKFAEKYLIGTLLSVAIVLFCITIGNLILVK